MEKKGSSKYTKHYLLYRLEKFAIVTEKFEKISRFNLTGRICVVRPH